VIKAYSLYKKKACDIRLLERHDMLVVQIGTSLIPIEDESGTILFYVSHMTADNMKYLMDIVDKNKWSRSFQTGLRILLIVTQKYVHNYCIDRVTIKFPN
jgi:hypothetical protein